MKISKNVIVIMGSQGHNSKISKLCFHVYGVFHQAINIKPTLKLKDLIKNAEPGYISPECVFKVSDW